MAQRTCIPYGPQHPVLPEPIHFDLLLEDEKIVDAVPSIGYIHRGLEMLTRDHDFMSMAYVAERICGICSFIHGMGYCQAVEGLMGVEVPERALWLRTIWSELSRLQSHTLWLGLLADAMGFESLFMHSWRVRELILDVFEETTGGRIIFNVCTPGGVRRDIDAQTLGRIAGLLPRFRREIDAVAGVFLHDASVKARLAGIGSLSREEAHAWGCVGPMARASGLSFDMRQTGYAAYGRLGVEPVVETGCDSMARVAVRVRELYQSLDLIGRCIKEIPAGDVLVKVAGSPPAGEFYARLEQPRGEVVYYVQGNGTKFLERFRVRTPTFANIPSMIHLIKGSRLSDVALLVLTIDPCISCTER